MSDASTAGQRGSIGAWLTALPAAVDGDAGLLRRGRWLDTTFQPDIGDATWIPSSPKSSAADDALPPPLPKNRIPGEGRGPPVIRSKCG